MVLLVILSLCEMRDKQHKKLATRRNNGTSSSKSPVNIETNYQVTEYTSINRSDIEDGEFVQAKRTLLLYQKTSEDSVLDLLFSAYIRYLVTCKVCMKILDDPYELPCCNSICKTHLKLIKDNACGFCHEWHDADNDVVPNQTFYNLISLGLHKTEKELRLEVIRKRFLKCVGIFFLIALIYWYFFY